MAWITHSPDLIKGPFDREHHQKSRDRQDYKTGDTELSGLVGELLQVLFHYSNVFRQQILKQKTLQLFTGPLKGFEGSQHRVHDGQRRHNCEQRLVGQRRGRTLTSIFLVIAKNQPQKGNGIFQLVNEGLWLHLSW